MIVKLVKKKFATTLKKHLKFVKVIDKKNIYNCIQIRARIIIYFKHDRKTTFFLSPCSNITILFIVRKITL